MASHSTYPPQAYLQGVETSLVHQKSYVYRPCRCKLQSPRREMLPAACATRDQRVVIKSVVKLT